jgi:hypothetical protein
MRGVLISNATIGGYQARTECIDEYQRWVELIARYIWSPR